MNSSLLCPLTRDYCRVVDEGKASHAPQLLSPQQHGNADRCHLSPCYRVLHPLCCPELHC
eukprot:2047570-Amphidinium_carterae.1